MGGPVGAAECRVAVATIARHHSFDLAREMERRDALAAIYTGLPRILLGDSGVDPARIRSFPWVQTPKQVLQRLRLAPPALERLLAWRALEAIDTHIASRLVPCDVLTALSGTGLRSGAAVQARGGAYVCDRGSTHIGWQDRILSEEYDRLDLPYAGTDPRIMEKETREYARADAITVPSSFVRDSFVEMGIEADKLHRIPYGVELERFGPSGGGDNGFRVLFVGTLSVRKGLHYLLQGFSKAALGGARLVLAGPADGETETILARSKGADVERLGRLDRARVAAEMARASVLVLPSVEEGQALVLAQALASGLPVIASRNTGAEDLFDDGTEGFIVPLRDADAIAERLVRLAAEPALRQAMAEAALRRVQSIGGWDTYGEVSLALFRDLAARAML